MMRAVWNALRVGGRGSLPAVEVTGPGVDDLVHAIAEALADATHYGDGLHVAWTNYATARWNLAAAKEFGPEDTGIPELEDSVAGAWDTLVADLPRAVRLHMAEARLVAGQLDEVAGRIGQVAA